MKKLNRRALSVMMISLFIILGLFTYIERFLRDGENWASYFSRLNSLSEGYVTDRNGVLLAAFTANDNSYNEDRNTRIANYHVTGDFWNRTGSGILTNFARPILTVRAPDETDSNEKDIPASDSAAGTQPPHRLRQAEGKGRA